MTRAPRLPPEPELLWSADDAPEAAWASDVYFSREGGLEETRRVFLEGCGLPDGWRGRARFAIGELGFGTGLNALATWDLWRRTRSPGAILHFVSIEGALMDAASAARALSRFPEVAPLAAALIARWPHRVRGPQRLWFADDGFALTVVCDEAESAAAGLVGRFDAWFLDGFAPARNPQMWTPAVMAKIAALSAPEARAATYTVAGSVRAALEAAGFAVAKRPGFGRKRERLEATLARAPAPAFTAYPYAAQAGPVAILGAGIAGAAIAAALARRGRETLVFEAAGAPAHGASGNPAGLVAPRLDRSETGGARLLRAAYLEALALYSALGPDVFAPCGVLEIAADARDGAALADFAADPPLPAALYQPLDGARALHPAAGVVRPRAAIERLLSGAIVRCAAPIAALTQTASGWRLLDATGRVAAEAGAVVLASGAALRALAQAAWAPITLSRGQIELAHVSGPEPAHAITSGAYAAPIDGEVIFGATFDPWTQADEPPAPDAESRARNLKALAALDPDLAQRVEPIASRASLRATTPDRLPIAGLLPDAPAYQARFAGLAKGRAPDLSCPAPALEGLYVLGGLGARGLTTAPILAERLASEICGEPQALDQAALEAAHPARFLLRALRRGQTLG